MNVPSGKPILSCNSTGLRQTQVKIEDKIYSCQDGIINVECLEYGENSCPGKILVCDIGSSHLITCTNGTLVGSEDLECGSISLGNPKSTLNCNRKTLVQIETRIPVTTTRAPLYTTRAPIKKPTRMTSTPAPIFEELDEGEVQKIDRIDTISEDNESDLMPQVKKAMENIFPHELLVKPAENLQPPKPYLPPFETQASRDLKESLNGIFPMDLLAISRGINSGPNSFDTRLSVSSNNQQTNFDGNQQTNFDGKQQTNFDGNQHSNFDGNQESNFNGNQQTNWNIKTGSNVDGIGFKTPLSNGGIDTRFAGNNNKPQNNFQRQQDFRDRLIFSD